MVESFEAQLESSKKQIKGAFTVGNVKFQL